ncbi:hypothetical protein NEOLI_002870 [Neolecta irregularis DAH-3]|uniref:Zonadhesin n=1 Tax=Neolecta irregularis (strain DAH-3) TaxID=1198029 RepID=A0A1U7LSI6_NEOID|nr:hypothetical protein NEOLI_002870 [Neolecta irregularis DAH-3]|eukprot:OLL25578.1 hypothetical protein NEOLI_002870 [Neolecta irregularis DAH-3]
MISSKLSTLCLLLSTLAVYAAPPNSELGNTTPTVLPIAPIGSVTLQESDGPQSWETAQELISRQVHDLKAELANKVQYSRTAGNRDKFAIHYGVSVILEKLVKTVPQALKHLNIPVTEQSELVANEVTSLISELYAEKRISKYGEAKLLNQDGVFSLEFLYDGEVYSMTQASTPTAHSTSQIQDLSALEKPIDGRALGQKQPIMINPVDHTSDEISDDDAASPYSPRKSSFLENSLYKEEPIDEAVSISDFKDEVARITIDNESKTANLIRYYLVFGNLPDQEAVKRGMAFYLDELYDKLARNDTFRHFLKDSFLSTATQYGNIILDNLRNDIEIVGPPAKTAQLEIHHHKIAIVFPGLEDSKEDKSTSFWTRWFNGWGVGDKDSSDSDWDPDSSIVWESESHSDLHLKPKSDVIVHKTTESPLCCGYDTDAEKLLDTQSISDSDIESVPTPTSGLDREVDSESLPTLALGLDIAVPKPTDTESDSELVTKVDLESAPKPTSGLDIPPILESVIPLTSESDTESESDSESVTKVDPESVPKPTSGLDREVDSESLPTVTLGLDIEVPKPTDTESDSEFGTKVDLESAPKPTSGLDIPPILESVIPLTSESDKESESDSESVTKVDSESVPKPTSGLDTPPVLESDIPLTSNSDTDSGSESVTKVDSESVPIPTSGLDTPPVLESDIPLTSNPDTDSDSELVTKVDPESAPKPTLDTPPVLESVIPLTSDDTESNSELVTKADSESVPKQTLGLDTPPALESVIPLTSDLNTEPNSESVKKVDSESVPKPTSGLDTPPALESVILLISDSDTESESDSDTESESDSDTESESDSELLTKVDSESVPKRKSGLDTASGLEPVIILTSDSDTESDSESDTTSSSDIESSSFDSDLFSDFEWDKPHVKSTVRPHIQRPTFTSTVTITSTIRHVGTSVPSSLKSCSRKCPHAEISSTRAFRPSSTIVAPTTTLCSGNPASSTTSAHSLQTVIAFSEARANASYRLVQDGQNRVFAQAYARSDAEVQATYGSPVISVHAEAIAKVTFSQTLANGVATVNVIYKDGSSSPALTDARAPVLAVRDQATGSVQLIAKAESHAEASVVYKTVCDSHGNVLVLVKSHATACTKVVCEHEVIDKLDTEQECVLVKVNPNGETKQVGRLDKAIAITDSKCEWRDTSSMVVSPVLVDIKVSASASASAFASSSIESVQDLLVEAGASASLGQALCSKDSNIHCTGTGALQSVRDTSAKGTPATTRKYGNMLGLSSTKPSLPEFSNSAERVAEKGLVLVVSALIGGILL